MSQSIFVFELAKTSNPSADVESIVTGDTLSNEDAKRLLSLIDDQPKATSRPDNDSSQPEHPPIDDDLRRAYHQPQTSSDENAPPTSIDQTAKKPALLSDDRDPIVAYGPQGAQKDVRQISILFRSDIAVLGSSPPRGLAQLQPPVDGTWRWLATNTLVFEPEAGSFPRSSRIRVTVKPSEVGVDRPELTWDFETPTLSLVHKEPASKAVNLSPMIYLAFDQPIDEDLVLAKLQLETENQPAVPLRKATEDESKEFRVETWWGKDSSSDIHPLLVTPTKPLERSTLHQVSLPPASYSLEGPLESSPNGFAFTTVDPLELKKSGTDAEYFDHALHISFNNQLDEDSCSIDDLSIAPPISNATLHFGYDELVISGRVEVETEYRITIPSSLRDQYGSELGEPTTVTRSMDRAPFWVRVPWGEYARKPFTLSPSRVDDLCLLASGVDGVVITVWKVIPQDWPLFNRFLNNYRDKSKKVPGEKVLCDTIPLNPREFGQPVPIRLHKALSNHRGHVVVNVRIPRKDDDYEPEYTAWIQVTDIGLTSTCDNQTIVTRATSIAKLDEIAKPMEGVRVELSNHADSCLTDSSGIACLPTLDPMKTIPNYLLASKGDNTTIVPIDRSTLDVRGDKQPIDCRWWVVCDRELYRPGDTVQVKGITRCLARSPMSALEYAPKRLATWTFFDAQKNEISKGRCRVDTEDGFDFQVPLAKDLTLGSSVISVHIRGDGEGIADRTFNLHIRVMEFRRPEFKVDLHSPSHHLFSDQSFEISLATSYFGGGTPSGLQCTWSCSECQTSFVPTGHDDFHFGARNDQSYFTWYSNTDDSDDDVESELKTILDDRGTSLVTVPALKEPRPNQPYRLAIAAHVTDVDDQHQSCETNLLVHPARRYVGLKTNRSFVRPHEPLDVMFVVTDVDGNEIFDVDVAFTLIRKDWRRENKSWKSTSVQFFEMKKTFTEDCRTVQFNELPAGEIELNATIVDQAGNENRTRIFSWVVGGTRPSLADTSEVSTTLHPDKPCYDPGDTARILIVSELIEATGILLVRCSGITRQETIQLKSGQAVVEVPVESKMIPSVTLQVELVGRTDSNNPANRISSCNKDLPISIDDRALPLEVCCLPERTKPGENVVIHVQAARLYENESSGLTVMVVDDAMLHLAGYTWPDICQTFYRSRPERFLTVDSRSNLIDTALRDSLESIQTAGIAMACRMGGVRGGSGAFGFALNEALDELTNDKVSERKEFRPLAHFVSAAEFDETGRAEIEVTLPDTLTTYRVLVAAWSGADRFGSAHATFDTRLPIAIHPALPRQLAVGDRVDLGVAIENQMDSETKVHVAVMASHLDLQQTGQSVIIPGNSRRKLAFAATAESEGLSDLSFIAVTDDGSSHDAVSAQIPISDVLATETVATYGHLDASNDKESNFLVDVPADSATDAQLRVGFAASAVEKIANLVVVLRNYDFDCAEQIASRILGSVTGGTLLTSFNVEQSTPLERVFAQAKHDILQLAKLQNDNGGFPFWHRNHRSVPIVSLRVAQAIDGILSRRQQIPDHLELPEACQGILPKLLKYVESLPKKTPSWYSQECKDYTVAYSFHIRHRFADSSQSRLSVEKEAAAWFRKNDILQFDVAALTLLLPVLGNSAAIGEEIHTHLYSKVDQTSAYATLISGESRQEKHLLLHSDRVTDATFLSGLLSSEPKHPLAIKLARGLLEGKSGRRFSSTYESGWILEALAKFVQDFESNTPQFDAFAWADNAEIQSPTQRIGKSLRHRSDTAETTFAFDPRQRQRVAIQAHGEGTLYWSAELKYSIDSATAPPVDQGFRISRKLVAVESNRVIDPDENGSYQLIAGTIVDCIVEFIAPSKRYHVAVVNPMPGCCESLPPEKSKPTSKEPKPWWVGQQRLWYDHVQTRDASVEAFSQCIFPGVYQLKHRMQITSTGTFFWPATWCEEMYRPETYGRSTANVVEATREISSIMGDPES